MPNFITRRDATLYMNPVVLELNIYDNDDNSGFDRYNSEVGPKKDVPKILLQDYNKKGEAYWQQIKEQLQLEYALKSLERFNRIASPSTYISLAADKVKGVPYGTTYEQTPEAVKLGVDVLSPGAVFKSIKLAPRVIKASTPLIKNAGIKAFKVTGDFLENLVEKHPNYFGRSYIVSPNDAVVDRPLTQELQLPLHLKELAMLGGTDPVYSKETMLKHVLQGVSSPKPHYFNGETFIALPGVPKGMPDAVTLLETRLSSYTPPSKDLGFIGIIPENRTTTNFILLLDNLPKEAVAKLLPHFGYGAVTLGKGAENNIQTHLTLLPKKYMITIPDYIIAHDYVHKYFRMDPTYQIPGAEGLDPNEALAIISGEIKPRFGLKAGEPITETHMNNWFSTTDPRLSNRYGFLSKIKNMSKFLDWANKVAPVSGAFMYNINDSENLH